MIDWWIIGEQPSGATSPEGALAGLAGRLARYAGVDRDTVLAIPRRNLLATAGVWDRHVAQGAAGRLDVMTSLDVGFVLCGRRVADAFGVTAGFFEWTSTRNGRRPVVVIPHPSGRNRCWNDPTVRTRCADTLGPILRRIHQTGRY